MGGTGNRHSKNCGTMGSENMTYWERKHMGFGTMKERLGKETVKEFDACALGLTHAEVRPSVRPSVLRLLLVKTTINRQSFVLALIRVSPAPLMRPAPS